MKYDLKEIMEICNKATEGPWETAGRGSEYVINKNNFNVCLTRRSYDAQFIALARTTLPEFAQRVVDLEKQLESLTPGGSEFHSDPERCIQWVKDRLATVSKQVKKRKEAEAENAKLRATIAAMQDALEEVKARCELRRQDDDAHYENYYEAKKALAAAGYGGGD